MEAQPDIVAAPMFSQVAFHIVISKDLDQRRAADLSEILQQYGAEGILPPSVDHMFELEGITHIISSTIDFSRYDAAVERMISVVKPSWVDSSLTKMKMSNPRSHSPDPKLFFSGLTVHVADLPENDKSAIIGGLESMGGIYASVITKQVTHVVALTMESEACRIVISKKLPVKVILPHWFDDCLRLGRRISEEPYLLPNPDILEPLDGIHPRPATESKLIGKSAYVDGTLVPPSSPRSRTVFNKHSIMLSKDLGVSTRLSDTITAIVEAGGGQLVQEVSMADTLVCQYREGDDFYEAGSKGITIGNLPWLFHVISTNIWTSPLTKLLHFPISRAGLPGCKAYRLSLSNYNGDARLYLENLAKAAGCEFTKSMKGDNTHLITAHTMSEKCDAAKEWNIHMVNHLWLEDSYSKWTIQSTTKPRYTYFPSRTNLGDVVGQTPIDKDALFTHFFQTKENERTATTPSVKAERVSEVNAVSAEIPKPTPPLSHRTKDTNAVPASAKQTPKPKAVEKYQTPVPKPVGKENETPSTGGRSTSRSAKAKALSNMSGYAEDFELLAKERKRKGGVVHGGRLSEEIATLQPGNHKRSVSTDSKVEPEPKSTKKPKQTRPDPQMKLLVTGYTKWSDNSLRSKDEAQLAELGIELTEDPIGCPFVAAPKILRTKKFICAIAGAPMLMNLKFIEQCLERNKLLRPQDYPLSDKDGEARYAFKLNDAIKKAKSNQGHLLKGQTIYITQDIRGGPDTYQDIVEANGGRCVVFKGRTTSLASTDGEDEDMADADSYIYLISGDTKAELSLGSKFHEQAESAGRRPRVVKTDWLLDLALAQTIRWTGTYEIKNQIGS